MLINIRFKLQLRNFKKYNKIDVIQTKTDEIGKQKTLTKP